MPLAVAVLAFHITFLRWYLCNERMLSVARTLALGAVLGLALLAKQTAPISFAGPALAVALRSLKAPQQLLNGITIVAVACAGRSDLLRPEL
jgi:hypothetical protein